MKEGGIITMQFRGRKKEANRRGEIVVSFLEKDGAKYDHGENRTEFERGERLSRGG